MMDFRYLGSGGYNLVVVPPDLPVFGAVRVNGDRWSLIGPAMGEPCGGIRRTTVLLFGRIQILAGEQVKVSVSREQARRNHARRVLPVVAVARQQPGGLQQRSK
jgi:hypothetical protein